MLLYSCTTRPIDMKAASTLTSTILAILFCVSAAGTRTKLLSVPGQNGASSFAASGNDDDGICISLVKKQGYICEEHTVINLLCLCFCLLKILICVSHCK